jgi:hypothetical protein
MPRRNSPHRNKGLRHRPQANLDGGKLMQSLARANRRTVVGQAMVEAIEKKQARTT